MLRAISARERETTKTFAAAVAKAAVSRERQYFGKVNSVGSFVNISRLYSDIMRPFGLIDMSYLVGLFREVLEAGISRAKNRPKHKIIPAANSLPRQLTLRQKARIQHLPRGPANQCQKNCIERVFTPRIGRHDQGAQMARYCQLIALQAASARRTLGHKILHKAV